MTQESLSLWTVYDHPKDFPDAFVARRFDVYPGMVLPTSAVLSASELQPIRETLSEQGFLPMPACSGDDPVIIEVWV